MELTERGLQRKLEVERSQRWCDRTKEVQDSVRLITFTLVCHFYSRVSLLLSCVTFTLVCHFCSHALLLLSYLSFALVSFLYSRVFPLLSRLSLTLVSFALNHPL